MTFRSIRTGALILLALCLASSAVLAKSEQAADYGYTSADQESYMTDALFFFFRPGLDFELISFEIPDDLQPLATFSLKDPGGVPLDMNGVFTPGPIDVRFMLTYIPEGSENKVNYHERSRDRGGEYTDLGNGVYSYKFATVLPSDYEVNATHTLASVATRDFRDEEFENLGLEGRYYDNDLYHFIPSGEGEPMPRDIVSTTTCNRCHDPLGEHGGRYQEVQVCQSCHNPDLYNEEFELSYSFAPMIHRVHAGTEPQLDGIHYPAIINDCQVCHTGGTPTGDFPLVANPAPAPTCDSTGLSMTEVSWGDAGNVEVRIGAADGTLFAAGVAEGSQVTGEWLDDSTTFVLVNANSGDAIQSVTPHTSVFGCVGNAPGAAYGDAAVSHTNWMTRPSRDVCGACHVDVDFETGTTGHPIMTDDETCSICHRATGDEYGFSVAGAHTVDYQSAQLGGVLVQVVDIANIGPGKRPVVTFSLSNKWGPLPPSYLGRLRFSLSGPNDDFSFYAQDDALDALQPDGANWKFRFETALPSDAMGSYSLGVEGRINGWVINEGKPSEFTMNDQMQNFIEPFAVTGDSIMSRREVVDDAKCESCHANLSLHGSNRHNATEYCQTCHMPSATDEEVRLEGLPATIDFRTMIHKIHRGADLEKGYVVYGYRSSVHDYSDVHYVGDLRNCEACHVNDSYTLPLPAGVLPVNNPQGPWNPMLPEAATCLSCHDGDSAASHALSNTSELGEACATCHGEGKRYSVEAVHAR